MNEHIRIIPQEQRVQEILSQTNAVLTGHFRYATQRHGEIYINKDAIYPHTKLLSEICRYMARPFQGKSIDTVAGPQMGGVLLSQLVASSLSKMEYKNINGVYAEKDYSGNGEEKLLFKRGYDSYIKDKNVLVVEDILNSGGSAKKMVDAVRNLGGNVSGVSAIVNRGGVTGEQIGDVPLQSLLDMSLESWEAKDCRLCHEGVPLNLTVGHVK